MATQQDTPKRDLVTCPFCGEDYSVTYHKCPFCDDRAGRRPSRPQPSVDFDFEDETNTETRQDDRSGGRRTVYPKRPSVEPVRIVGYALGLILIIAAIYIVCTMLAPLFGGNDPAVSGSNPQSSSGTSASTSQPDVSTPDVSTPDVSTPDVSAPGVITPVVKTTAITLSTTDFTLKPDETHKVVATLTPANSDEAVTWTSSDSSIATVNADGSITNVNTGSTQKVVTVTATSGSFTAQCTVRCKPGSSGTATPPAATTPTPTTPTAPTTPTTPVASGTVGIINNDGVRIRTAPVTGSVQDSATKNAEITILEKTAEGWYKIRYNGNGGVKDGYIRADFVDIKSN